MESHKSCFMSQDENGRYSLTIAEGGHPIVNQDNLTLKLALKLINEFMYGNEVYV